MKRSILVFAFILFSPSVMLAQQRLHLYKTFGGVVFKTDSIDLSIRQTRSILFRNQQAYLEFNKAKRKGDLAAVFGFTGAALIAIPLVSAGVGGSPEWILAAGGAALILGSIPLISSYRAHALYAIDIYNESLPTSRIRPELYFYGTGARLVIKF